MGVIDIVAFLLIGLIAYATMGEGIFGAIIVLCLSVVCGAIALNFYEPITSFLGHRHIPFAAFDGYADAVVFLLLYGGSLLGLRALFDHFLTERVKFPQHVDRIGAIAIGVITGILTVGAFLVACQMMPLNKNFLGYKRERPVLGISPDATFLTLMHHLSTTVLDRPSYTSRLAHPKEIRDHYFRLRWPPGEEQQAPPG